MASESSPDAHVDAVAWDFERERNAARRLVKSFRDQAVPRIRAAQSVRDILLTEQREACRLGKRRHLSNRAQGVIIHGYKLCGGAKCPRCAPGWLDDIVCRCLRAWDGDSVYRTVFSEQEWRTSRRAKRLRRAYARRYLRVRIVGSGEQWVFTPGKPNDGAIPVGPDVGVAIIEALLLAPAEGKRRYQAPPREKSDPADDAEAEARDPDDVWRQEDLPSTITPQQANEIVSQALGRTLDWAPASRRGYWHAWAARGLTRGQIDAARAALQIYFEKAGGEREQLKELRRPLDDMEWELIRRFRGAGRA